MIQIYYAEEDLSLPALDIQMAELMARRLKLCHRPEKDPLSFTRSMKKKDAIVQKVFQKMGTREGVKMKDVFNRLIPEIADIINVQSCPPFFGFSGS